MIDKYSFSIYLSVVLVDFSKISMLVGWGWGNILAF